MVSERVLRRWRKDALLPISKDITELMNTGGSISQKIFNDYLESKGRILLLTQELMDLYLIKKGE